MARVAVTQIVDAVAKLKEDDSTQQIGYSTLEKELGIHRGQIMRDARKAISKGWIIDNQIKKYGLRDLVLGDPVPSGEGLPTPESVRHAVTHVTVSGADDDKCRPLEWEI